MWQGGDIPLEHVGANPVEKREIGGKKKEREEEGGERSSTLYLEFSAIGLSTFVGARGKVLLRDKSFAWLRESEVFAKLREVGVLLLLGLFLV